MQTSKKSINHYLEKQIHNLFYQVFSDFHNPQEAQDFLKDFLTTTELEVLVKRLAVAYYLSQKQSYEKIKTNLAVSSTTIATVSEQLKKEGFKLALKKIKAEEWADKWANKLTNFMKLGRK